MTAAKAPPVTPEEAAALLAPLAQYTHVALAVSGGPDSLALLHLASRVAARWREERGGGPDLTVLTVDHALRQGSRAEAEMVARASADLGLPHAILTWEHGDAADTGVQEKARAARYHLMTAYAHAHGIQAIVTAHHLDDQAETFLMRLKRGSGLDGLAAIPERSTWDGVTILRPLLDVPKARLVATLEEQGIAYASDPSNADPRFERARMRAATDALAELGLTPEMLALTARRLRRAREALDHAADTFLADHSKMHADHAVIDQDALLAAPQEIALRALARIIEAVGGSEEPVRLAKLEALCAALSEHPNTTQTLGHCRIEPKGRRLAIFREQRRKRSASAGPNQPERRAALTR
jgi:tRNA(Ile)-lysidine synthase